MTTHRLAVLVGVLVATGLVATPAHATDEGCGTAEIADEAMDAIAAAADADTDDDKADEAGTIYTVQLHLHVLRRAPGGEGDLPPELARSLTVDTLNDVFADQSIPFRFSLASLDYTNVDAATYALEQNSDAERRIYDATAKRKLRAIDMYIVGPRAGTSVTGWAEFLVNPALGRGDHVVLRYFPDRRGFSDPTVVVHEVGHWMGLLHTFHFGCGGLAHGDLIYDTPTQASGHGQCGDVDTCGDDDGLDPVDNVMGYGHSCRGLFSRQQIRRMKLLWRTARGGKVDDEVVVEDAAVTDAAGGCTTTGSPSLASSLMLLAVLAVLAASRRRRVVAE